MSPLVLTWDSVLKATEDWIRVRILEHLVKTFLPISSKSHRLALNETNQAIIQVPEL